MYKTIKGIAVGILAVGILSGCGTNEEDNNTTKTEKDKTEQEASDKKKENKEAGLGIVGNYGKVTVISEAEPYTLEGNKNVDYTLSDIKMVKIEDFTEDAVTLAWKLGLEDVSELPDSVYAVIGTEKKKNNTDISIEFTGIKTMAAGSKQIDVIDEDFAEDKDSAGSNMLSGVEREEQFAVLVEDPDIATLKFVLSRAFDSETMTNDFLQEQEFERTLNKK
ncbi:hypothetical protein [Peribacillus frigoritolerans]|uniref:Lipoprotein n=1 Tax=Peribacillus frigoritolerans TaxID=450367 RepID=A0AAJ1QJI4_9BACI|nr:hypothetical protein [Peribacillus frigoritolerans]MDM5282667.1 hypothetical protein [Peribacillus frigoritolerans]